eukprot:GSMAST32.ASY1.ANO1.1835.1 assembled CDS
MPKVSRKATHAKKAPGPLPTGAKGGRGQHFLKNPAVVRGIVAKAKLKSTDIALEIGCGNGIMTIQMLEICKKVIVVEIDPRMIMEVKKRVQGTDLQHKLEVIKGDALKVDLPYFDVCVANIPYQISSALTFKLIAHRPFFRSAVIMFQEEFAMRLSAQPGSAMYCRLAVNCQLLAKVSQLMKVSKNNFRPPPKVESRVVRIEPRVPAPPVNFLEWDGLVKLCFNRKNKTLGSIFRQKKLLSLLEKNTSTIRSLSSNNNNGNTNSVNETDMMDRKRAFKNASEHFKKLVEKVLAETKTSTRRSSQLTIDNFLELLAAFNKAGIHFTV